jgi:hypothetical protein
VCLLSLAEKNRVSRSVGFIIIFFKYFFILQFSEFGFSELSFVIFLYLLTVLNTLSTVINDIIPFGSRGRQNLKDIKNFLIKSCMVGVIGSVR